MKKRTIWHFSSVTLCSILAILGYASAARCEPSETVAASRAGKAVASATLLEIGTGAILPGITACASGACPGVFSAALSGKPLGKANLTMNVSADSATDGFTGCSEVVGTGGINDDVFTVSFVGQVCASGGALVSISGAIQMISVGTSASPVPAATGTLTAYGPVRLQSTSTPIPESGPLLVSLTGAFGQIPATFP